MKLLGIPKGSFDRDDAEIARMGTALTRGRFPDRAQMEEALATIKRAAVPLLVISSGSNSAFMATGAIAAKAGGGKHVIAPADHHFPQWNTETFNPLLENFWKSSAKLERVKGIEPSS